MDVLHEHIDQNHPIDVDGRMDISHIMSGDVNKKDWRGNTLLHVVLRQNITNVGVLVKHLLEMGAEVNAVNNSGLSPLHYAILYGNCSFDVLKLLIDRGAKVHQRPHFLGFTLLKYVIEKEFPLDVIKLLFENTGDNHFDDELGVNLMHFAVVKKLPVDFVQLLLDRGVDYLAVSGNNNHGESVIHLAVAFKRIEILKLLLKQPGVQVDAPDFKGYSPLHHSVATSTCDTDIIELLLNSGANVNKTTNTGIRAMHFAMYFCKIEVVKLLLKHGAQVNVLEGCGRTPLYLAVKYCHSENIEVLKLLLDAGASVFSQSSSEIFPRDKSPYDSASSALLVASERHYYMQSGYSLQRVQLLLKYALLERPEITYENLSDDKQTCAMLSQYGSKCLHELNSTCINGSMTLAQLILCLRLQQDEIHTDDILDLLVAGACPLYREVISSLLKKKELEEKFKDRNVFTLRGLGQPCPLRHFVLHYDALCIVMKYLPKVDLLNLLLSFYKAHSNRRVDFPLPSAVSQNVIEAESERVVKRAKVSKVPLKAIRHSSL